MEREWTDRMGDTWTVEVLDADWSDRVGGADGVLSFSGEGALARSLEFLGPLPGILEELDDDALEHALDAAGSAVGVFLVDDEGTLWWVRGPEAEAFGAPWTLKFSDGSRELTHDEPLPDELEALGEDHLRELLDDARGRIMDPMDVDRED